MFTFTFKFIFKSSFYVSVAPESVQLQLNFSFNTYLCCRLKRWKFLSYIKCQRRQVIVYFSMEYGGCNHMEGSLVNWS